ncbi:hypothetical protein J8I87_11685 [Paraburkholderia sp. LEh10]|uniref:HEPN/Toprim-associated domain-containing protein n=1 Tax=Paraburkholderia sp. LEh10 TaxID=2821353 RepID=UPI001AE91A81|nr:HEPN/Toprim-associated domain-containing protein [Paraburkholderia sp. LEh10]MBP0590361.1 hypothetical protein [Paraburkholderia sp. LEh10]
MTFRAYYMFDGYPAHWVEESYYRWLFTRKDRVIRHRTKGERNVLIRDLPENRAEWDKPETDYLYVVTAEELRRRLSLIPCLCPVSSITYIDEDTKYGQDMTSLRSEFERYRREMIADTAPTFYVSTSAYYAEEAKAARKRVPERADALRGTTLDDWLMALKDVVERGATRAKGFTSPPMPNGPTFDTKALADIILTDQYPCNSHLRPHHDLWGFPCSLLEHLAVAMLEVIPANAECVLDVTELVVNDCVYCFDDLILAAEESALA